MFVRVGRKVKLYGRVTLFSGSPRTVRYIFGLSIPRRNRKRGTFFTIS